MKIGIVSTAYFGFDDYAAGFACMKRHGYDCVDINHFVDTENELFTCSNAEFERILGQISSSAEENGIEVFQVHGPWRFPPQDATKEDRAERFEKMAKSLWGCALLGCKYLVIHPIMPYGCDSDPEPERLWEINLEYYTRLAEEARKCGTILCLENMPMPGISLARPAEILKLVKEINSPYLRICLDTGHCTMFGQPSEAVRLLGNEYIRTLHIHDNNGRNDLHQLPFTGVIDWDAFCQALHDIGFNGVISLETSVNGKFPPKVREYMEIGVAEIARTLADKAAN